MDMEPIKRMSVTDQVYDRLRLRLVHGEWKPGDRLPSENELAVSLGVSRITVRQALQRLVTLGLLETKFGEGTFVKVYTPGMMMQQLLPAIYLKENSLLEVIEFRRLLEVPAAELAAQKAEEKDIDALSAIYDRMQSLHAGGGIEFFRADLDFHLEMAEITKNSLVIETCTILRDTLEYAMERIVKIRGDSQGLYYHRLLLDAMRAHDSALCRKVMDEHLTETYNSIKMVLNKDNGLEAR